MSIDKALAILAARTPGRWTAGPDSWNGVNDIFSPDGPDGGEHILCRGHDYDDYGQFAGADARAIVLAVNTIEAALAVASAARALLAAWEGRSHPGEPHDRDLHAAAGHRDADCLGTYNEDCAKCGGAMYGTEPDLRDALAALDAAIEEATA